MSKIRSVVENIAKTDMTILIRGETGTGKQFVAQAIHAHSHRSEKPLVKVNCAALPPALLETELFGHEQGAFMNAHHRKPGKLELANHGTILLSEVGELNMAIQPRLLHALQDGAFSRPGGDRTISLNVRVIATTRDDLETSIREGCFREDLFYRINVISITLPPLRDRREQIIPMTQFFLNHYRAKFGLTIPPLSFKTLSLLKAYAWPGNIRQLENTINQLVLLEDEEMVQQELLRKAPESSLVSVPAEQADTDGGKTDHPFDLKSLGRKAAEKAELKVIRHALDETRWNRKQAAKRLGVSYKSLLSKIQKYRLEQVPYVQDHRGRAG